MLKRKTKQQKPVEWLNAKMHLVFEHRYFVLQVLQIQFLRCTKELSGN